jgi:hypothetical protein
VRDSGRFMAAVAADGALPELAEAPLGAGARAQGGAHA